MWYHAPESEKKYVADRTPYRLLQMCFGVYHRPITTVCYPWEILHLY